MHRSIVVLLIAVFAASLLFVIGYTGSASQNPRPSPCPTTNLEKLDLNFTIRTPAMSSLPPDYRLQAAIQEGEDNVKMYFSDRELCPFPRLFEGQLPQGTMMISVSQRLDIESGEMFVQDALAFKRESIPGIKQLDINGMDGYGWESFVFGQERQDTDVGLRRFPSTVEFYNESEQTAYSVVGLEPLSRLVEIAKSIS